jgi:hypothetical protein
MRWENDGQTLLGNPIRDKPWALIWSGDNSSRRGVAYTWFYRCPFVFFASRRLTFQKNIDFVFCRLSNKALSCQKQHGRGGYLINLK